MSVPADLLLSEARETKIVVKNEHDNVLTKTVTATSLAGVAATAYFAQKHGIISDLPSGIKELAESARHPILGYAGAWVATEIQNTAPDRIKSKIPKWAGVSAVAITGATTANFGAEFTQKQLVEPSEDDALFSFETAKDYLVALGSMILFLAQSRLIKRPERLT